MRDLSKFVSIYDDVIPKPICKDIITLFEESEAQQMKSNVGENVYDLGYRNAIELNCSKQERFNDMLSSMTRVAMNMRKKYFADLIERGVPEFSFPPGGQLRLEEWRMHRYDDSSTFFKPHSDDTGKRYLALLFYMNDVAEGGETRFTDHLAPLECRPNAGRLLMFPTWWGFPHEAMPPVSNPKYLLKTYFHYV